METNYKENCTKGIWVQNGNNGVHTSDGNCIALTYKNKNEDAKLIAEAGTVLNETGFTPRELANQNKALLEALQGLVKRCEESEIFTATPPYFKAKEALAALQNADKK